MSTFQKTLYAVGGTVILMTGMSFLISQNTEPFSAPEAFLETREELAEISREVANLMNGSLDAISQIDSFHRAGDKESALAIVREQVALDQTRTKTALRIATKLGTIVEMIPEIEPQSAQVQLASITEQGTTLTTYLVGYQEELRDLFLALQVKLQQEDDDISDFLIERVTRLNAEADLVNGANDRLNQMWRTFDQSF